MAVADEEEKFLDEVEIELVQYYEHPETRSKEAELLLESITMKLGGVLNARLTS